MCLKILVNKTANAKTLEISTVSPYNDNPDNPIKNVIGGPSSWFFINNEDVAAGDVTEVDITFAAATRVQYLGAVGVDYLIYEGAETLTVEDTTPTVQGTTTLSSETLYNNGKIYYEEFSALDDTGFNIKFGNNSGTAKRFGVSKLLIGEVINLTPLIGEANTNYRILPEDKGELVARVEGLSDSSLIDLWTRYLSQAGGHECLIADQSTNGLILNGRGAIYARLQSFNIGVTGYGAHNLSLRWLEL